MADSEDTNLDDFLGTARKRFAAASEDEKELRAKFAEDLKFASPDGDDQWDIQVRQQRQAAGRPVLSFPRCHTFVQQVSNDARQRKPQIKFSPRINEDKDTAEVLEGLARYIQYDSQAQVAYETAIEYSAGGSFGYYRFLTDYVDDESDDLELKVVPVLDPMQIYGILVPACFNRKPKFAFVVEDMPRDEFKAEYPKSEVVSLGWAEAEKASDGWIGSETVRIAEYWYVEETKVKGKKRPQCTVKFCKTNGLEILPDSETVWPGSCIPIIPVLGKQMIIDGKPRLYSVVRPQKGAQQMLNYAKTRIAETLSTSPISPFIAAKGQITNSGMLDKWKSLNTTPVPVLEYDTVDVSGRPAPPPQRQTFEPPIAALSAFVAQEVDDMKATTGIFDASLGSQSNETSGKAIFARQQQSNLSTMHYLDNLQRSFKHGGDVIAEVVPKIYDTEREIEILGEDEKQKIVTINSPRPGPDGKRYKVAGAKMSYVVTMGRAFDSKRMETFDTVQQLVQGNPQSFPLVADVLFRQSDMAGGEELAERFHKMLPPQLQNTEDNPLPPQAQAAIAQAQQQMGLMQGELQKLQFERAAKIAEHQGKMQQIAAQAQADMALEDKKLLTAITVAEINTKAQNAADREADRRALEAQFHDQAHDVGMAAVEHAHAQDMAAQQAAHAQDAQAQAAEQQQAQPDQVQQ